MSKRSKILVSLVVALSLMGSFALGYFIGEREARREFPSPAEIWQKESGVRIERGISSCTLWFPDGTYRMYYTVAEGIVSAVSYDGLRWFKEPGVRISPDLESEMQVRVGSPTVFRLKDGRYRMIYEGSDERDFKRALFSAVSRDGVNWQKESGVRLLDINEYGEKIASAPHVVSLPGGRLRLYYTDGYRIKSAISNDEGIHWKKEELTGIDPPALDPQVIHLEGGGFKMYYVISASTEELKKLQIVSATSEDGLHWIKDNGVRIRPSRKSGAVMEPDVLKISLRKYRMYYSELERGSLSSGGEPPIVSIRSATLEKR